MELRPTSTRLPKEQPKDSAVKQRMNDWPVNDVKTRLFNGGDSVKVSYEYDESGFDYTVAELDDLAEQHGGQEVSS